jgi:hypothetical protein
LSRELLALPERERLTALLQGIADGEEAWGLRREDGWVLDRAEDPPAFPLWPHPDLAGAWAVGERADAEPAAIPLGELLEDLLPLLEEDGLAVSAFPVPEGRGLALPAARFRAELEAELELGE